MKMKVTCIFEILLNTWILSLTNASISSLRGTIIPDFNDKIVSDVLALEVQNSENVIECIRKCGNTEYCLSVFYHDVTGKCQMHSETYNTSVTSTDSNGFRHYVLSRDPACPSQKGYMVTDTYNLCIRFINETVTQENAQKTCESDSGHLLVITFQEMDIYMRNLLPAQQFYWISGSDASVEGDWRYWNNEPMPYLFAPNENNGGSNENCVFIDNAVIGDISCNVTLPSICQIDVQ